MSEAFRLKSYESIVKSAACKQIAAHRQVHFFRVSHSFGFSAARLARVFRFGASVSIASSNPSVALSKSKVKLLKISFLFS